MIRTEKNKIMVIMAIAVLTFSTAALVISNNNTRTYGTETHGNPLIWIKDGKLYYESPDTKKMERIPGTEDSIAARMKYFVEDGKIYLAYQDYSVRSGQVKLMIYDSKWSKPVVMGADYMDFVMFRGIPYVISSDMENVYISYLLDGEKRVQKIYRGRTVATALGVNHGNLYAFWADNRGAVYFSKGSSDFLDYSVIYRSEGAIHNLSFASGTLKVVEKINGYLIERRFSEMNGEWAEMNSKVLREPRSVLRTRTVDDEFYARQNETGKWVLIVYLDGDNNLGDDNSEYDVGDLNEMESVYDDSDVGLFDIVVLWDHKGSADPDTHVLWIRHDDTGQKTTDSPSTVRSPLLDTHYPLLAHDSDHELYLSNYHVFVDFVEWVVHNFPAEHYFVDIWDHGGGYDGVVWDDDAGGDSWSHDHITLGDMHDATLQLYNDLYPTLGRTLDIIGYDTCLTNHGGIQYHNKIMFDYVGASEHTEGGYGWSYDTVLSEMVSTQGEITADKQAYNLAYHVNDDGGIVTYAVINTTLWDYRWMPAYNALAQAMKHKAGSENKAIKDAFSNSADADGTYWTTAHDYWDMVNNHIIGDGEISDSTILYWAHRLVENMTRNSGSYSPGKLIPYSQDTDTSGKKLMMADSTDSSEIGNHKDEAWIFVENEWDEMVSQVNAGSDVNNNPPTVEITSPGDNANVARTAGTLRIEGTAADSDGSVQKVQVKIDRGYWQDATGTDSWYYDWDISNVPYGWHHIMVRAFDGEDFSWDWKSIDVEIIESAVDLTVSGISLSSSQVNEGDILGIQASVKNVGDVDVDGVYVGFYYDSISPEHHIGNVSLGSLSVGETKDAQISWDTTNHSGNHIIIAMVDPGNTIAEKNENNNTANATVKIVGYGVALDVDQKVKGVKAGEGINYTLTVKNTGTESDIINVYADDPPAGWNVTIYQNSFSLNPGESGSTILRVTAPANATAGEMAKITVWAQSSGDQSKKDTVNVTTKVIVVEITSMHVFSNIEAVINFTTSTNVSTYIEYGIGPSLLNMKTAEDSSGTNHEFAIQNLTPGVNYYFRIHMNDGSSEIFSEIYNFTPSGANDLEENDNPEKMYDWLLFGWDNSSGVPDPATSLWQLGTPSAGPGNAHSGTRVFATDLAGDYGVDNHIDALVLPWVDATNATWLTLSFYAWYDLEKSYDGVVVKYQNDESSEWHILDIDNKAGQYDETISTSYSSDIGGHYAFTGTSNGWILKNFNTSAIGGSDASNILGHKVRFIIYFASDSSQNAYYGMAVDDLRISMGIPKYHIYGYVRDSSGNGVPGAKVWVNNTDLGISLVTTTDTNGFYEIYTHNGRSGDDIEVESVSSGYRGTNSSTLDKETEIDITLTAIPELNPIIVSAFALSAIFVWIRRKY